MMEGTDYDGAGASCASSFDQNVSNGKRTTALLHHRCEIIVHGLRVRDIYFQLDDCPTKRESQNFKVLGNFMLVIVNIYFCER